jgi:hypothetical protein
MVAIALPRMGFEPEPEPGVEVEEEDLGMAGDGDGCGSFPLFLTFKWAGQGRRIDLVAARVRLVVCGVLWWVVGLGVQRPGSSSCAAAALPLAGSCVQESYSSRQSGYSL